MLLSTLQCSTDLCDHFFSADEPMAEVIRLGEERGWAVLANGAAFCPDHSGRDEGRDPTEKWVVGCFTCDFEEEYDSEEDAKYEYEEHECEPDTWLHDPLRVKQDDALRVAQAERWKERSAQDRRAAEEAEARQDQIEKDAANWLRLRNLVLFWKKRI